LLFSAVQDGKEAVQESWLSMHRQALLVGFALAVFAFLLSYPIFKVRRRVKKWRKFCLHHVRSACLGGGLLQQS
jgi:hypothetical protein